MKIIVMTENPMVAERLTRPVKEGEEIVADLPTSFRISEPRLIPGAVGGWFEIAVSFGLTSIPASVAASLIANWIWHAWKAGDSKDEIVKAKIETDSSLNTIDFSNKNLDEIAALVRKILDNDNTAQ